MVGAFSGVHGVYSIRLWRKACSLRRWQVIYPWSRFFTDCNRGIELDLAHPVMQKMFDGMRRGHADVDTHPRRLGGAREGVCCGYRGVRAIYFWCWRRRYLRCLRGGFPRSVFGGATERFFEDRPSCSRHYGIGQTRLKCVFVVHRANQFRRGAVHSHVSTWHRGNSLRDGGGAGCVKDAVDVDE